MVIFKINGMMTKEGLRDGRYQSLKVNESQKRRGKKMQLIPGLGTTRS